MSSHKSCVPIHDTSSIFQGEPLTYLPLPPELRNMIYRACFLAQLESDDHMWYAENEESDINDESVDDDSDDQLNGDATGTNTNDEDSLKDKDDADDENVYDDQYDSDYEVGIDESDEDSTDSDDEDHDDSCEKVLGMADKVGSGHNSHGTLLNEEARGDLRREEEAFDDGFSDASSDAFSGAFSDESSDNGLFDEDSSEESSCGDRDEEGLADNNESSDEVSSDGRSDETDDIQAKNTELVFFDLKVPHRQPTVSLLNHDTQREALSEMMRIATIFLDTTIADKNIAAINGVNFAWMDRAGRALSTIRNLRLEAAIFHKHPIIPSRFGAVCKSMTPYGTPFRRNRCLSQLDFTFRPDAVCHYTVIRIHEDGIENQGFPDEKWLPVLKKIAKKAAKTLERIIRIQGGHFGVRELEILWKWMLNQKSYPELATSPFQAVGA